MFVTGSVPSDAKARRRWGLSVLVVFALVFLLIPTPGPSARASGSWIVVDEDTAHIWGEGWMPGSKVSIAIDLDYTPVRPDFVYSGVPVSVGGSFDKYVGAAHWPTEGDLITVADGGGMMATHEMHPVTVMNSDEAADTVTGIGRPGALVKAWISGTLGTEQLETVDASGRWLFDYKTKADLKAGTSVVFRQYDDAGNATQTTTVLPVPEDFDADMIRNMDDNCPWTANSTQYDGDRDGRGAACDAVDRLWGANRYGTAQAVTRAVFDHADTVFIALGSNFPDALVAAAAGGHLSAPVLLTRSDSLPAETIVELLRLSPHNAYVVGGTAVIRPSVEQQLRTYVPNVTRLAGADRYGTAAEVAKKLFPAANEAFVALGSNFPDALVAAAPAGMLHAPVLLTARDHAPAAMLAVLAAMHPTKIYIVDGTAAISVNVARELAGYGPVERLSGPSRYATAAVVGDRFFGTGNTVFLAYARNFPDALVAAAAGGRIGAPVLLIDRTSIPPVTRSSLDRLQPLRDWIVGGEAVIGPGVFNALP